jgi:hypothetical protein
MIATFAGAPAGKENQLSGDGRDGYWYTYCDCSNGIGGTMTPACAASFVPEGQGYDDSLAAHVAGSGYNGKAAACGWTGAGLGVNFTTSSCPYDASAYTGIQFYAKSSTSSPVRFSMATVATKARNETGGGTCCSGGDPGNSSGCDNHFGSNITLTPTWTLYSYPWNQLAQPSWGILQNFDPKTLIGMQWQVSDAAATSPFDIWVDAVAFTR